MQTVYSNGITAPVQHGVLFQGASVSLKKAIQAIDPGLQVGNASAAKKPQILNLLRDFYLGQVDPASAKESGYENQGAKIMNVHEAVIDANLKQTAKDLKSPFLTVSQGKNGPVVATAALLQTALNGSHQPPSDAGQMSYFYKANGVPDAVSLALVDDLAKKAKSLGMKSLYCTARRKGMDARNHLMQAAGFKEVTDPKRVAQLVPPILQSPRTVVYEKPLG